MYETLYKKYEGKGYIDNYSTDETGEVYTDRHIIFSTFPEKIPVFSDKPDYQKVIDKIDKLPGGIDIYIPADFYKYLSSFKPRKNNIVNVYFLNGCIVVYELEDNMEFVYEYRQLSLPEPHCIDANMIRYYQPSIITFYAGKYEHKLIGSHLKKYENITDCVCAGKDISEEKAVRVPIDSMNSFPAVIVAE